MMITRPVEKAVLATVSAIISADSSPVKAPLPVREMFWLATSTPLVTRALTVSKWSAVGATTTSTAATATTNTDGTLAVTAPALGLAIYAASTPVPAATQPVGIAITSLADGAEVVLAFEDLDGHEVLLEAVLERDLVDRFVALVAVADR